MASDTVTDAITTEKMEIESVNPTEAKEYLGKRDRDEGEQSEIGTENDAVLKKPKVAEDGPVDDRENVGPVSLGPKTFGSSMDMYNYFYKLLHNWPVNVPANKYEYLVLLDLIKKGHAEPDKKSGSGVDAFEIRYHPMYNSRCFFVVRDDNSVEDFSFRKCVDQIHPLPENMKMKSDAKDRSGGYGKGKKGGGGGGGRGGGPGHGGGRGRNGRCRR